MTILDTFNFPCFSTQPVLLPVITSGASSSPGCQHSVASHLNFHWLPESASALFTGWYSRYFYCEGGIFWRSSSDHTMRVWTEAMTSCRSGDYKEAVLLPEIRAAGNILSRWETQTDRWGCVGVFLLRGSQGQEKKLQHRAALGLAVI